MSSLIINFVDELTKYQEKGDLDAACRVFLAKAAFDVSENVHLSTATDGQFKNVLYCQVRRGRLTSTKFYSVLSRKKQGAG